MSDLADITSPTAIRKAMAEYDAIGQGGFLEKYGFGKAYRFLLKNGIRRYDSKAILGAAYGYQHPRKGPLKPSNFSGGEKTVARRLDSLGFDVVVLQKDGQELPLLEFSAQKMTRLIENESGKADKQGEFDPSTIEDARKRIRAGIILRRGQPKFRMKLLNAYGSRCAISDCDCVDALEAAHIHPYWGDETNHIANGLLLRADLHTLFDLGKIAVEPRNYTILVASELRKTIYGQFHGKRLRVPHQRSDRPNTEVLTKHKEMAGL